jgi:hypothetical protein
MAERIDEREADVLRNKMYPDAKETTVASIVTDMSARIAAREARGS